MKKIFFGKGISLMAATAMIMALLTGCGEHSNASGDMLTKERYVLDSVTTASLEKTTESVTMETYAANLFTAASREAIYKSDYGWSVKYDPEMFLIYEDDKVTYFNYMGESAGTNMITVTYNTEKNAEKAINEIGKPYGGKAYYTQGIFPGTDDTKGYYVTLAPDKEGSGFCMSAAARDYKDGALVFESFEHMGEDEFNNIEVSDALASIIDSVQFSK